MTNFSDQLLDDLMREHGAALAQLTPAAARRHRVPVRRTVLAGGGVIAVAAGIAGVLVAGSGSPAYAVTTNPNGTINLAVYQPSGVAGANARLRQLGDKQVVVVPIRAGCPSSFRPPVLPGRGHEISTATSVSPSGSVTVDAKGIPAGDILVLGVKASGKATFGAGVLTSGPAPSCISVPATPPPGH